MPSVSVSVLTLFNVTDLHTKEKEEEEEGRRKEEGRERKGEKEVKCHNSRFNIQFYERVSRDKKDDADKVLKGDPCVM